MPLSIELARPNVGAAEPCEANTLCLLRLRRTDNRPSRVEYNRDTQSADSRCYPLMLETVTVCWRLVDSSML